MDQRPPQSGAVGSSSDSNHFLLQSPKKVKEQIILLASGFSAKRN
jgi:hypothetical protein